MRFLKDLTAFLLALLLFPFYLAFTTGFFFFEFVYEKLKGEEL